MDYLLNCFYIEKATEEHTSTVLCPPLFTFCLKKKKTNKNQNKTNKQMQKQTPNIQKTNKETTKNKT